MKRTITASALALVFLSACYGQTTVNKTTSVEESLATNQRGIANTVEGTLTVNGEVHKMTYAYARRVQNDQDKSKQDILILFADRAVARQALEASGSLHFALGKKATNDELRGLEATISEEEIQEDGKVVLRKTVRVQIYHPALSAFGFDLGGFFPNVESVSVTRDQAQGKLSGKSDSKYKDYKYEVNFKVSLRPEEWSGIIYKQPPTNLAPGTARGQVLIDGKPVKLNHVYAVQQDAAGDLWGDEEMSVRLFFTDKPVPDPEAAFRAKERETFQRLKQSGNNHVVYVDLTPQTSSSDPLVRQMEKPDDMPALVVAETNLLLTKFDKEIVDGRIFNDGAPIESAPTMDVSFNASVIKSDPVNGPVTAGNGQPLPAGGGAPGAAYLNFIKAMAATRNFREMKALLEFARSATLSEEVRTSLAAVPAEREVETFRVYKAVLTIANAKVEGGFMNGDKATLWVSGSEDGKKATARFNMHRENGQWKVGNGSTRVK